MAKLKMKKVSIYALKKDESEILELLQKMSVLDVMSLYEEDSAAPAGFTRTDTKETVREYNQKAKTAQTALEVLDGAAPEKKGLLDGFCGRRELENGCYADIDAGGEDTYRICNEISEANRKLAENRAESVRISNEKEQYLPWKNLDVDINFRGTKTTSAFIGILPGRYTLESLFSAIAENAGDALFDGEIIECDELNTYIFIMCRKRDEELIESSLEKLSFSRPVSGIKGVPSERTAEIENRITAIESEYAQLSKKIVEYAQNRRQIEEINDAYITRAGKYEAAGAVNHTENTVQITGYIPEIDLPLLCEKLEQNFTVAIEHFDAAGDNVPVKLKNNKFFTPAETVTEMYALPSSKDIDPTPLTGIFYYLFFGMMLADAGYGLLLTLGSWFLIKKCKPEPATKKNLLLFLYCGVSTFLWGLFYGSFFGDLLFQLFGQSFNLPKVLDPMNGDAVTMMILSLALGYIQIIAGLVAKFVTCCKNKDFAGAFFDAGLWITGLLGVGLIAVGIALGPMYTKIGMYTGIISAVGLVLTQGRSSKGIMKAVSGVASLYDVTGYMSDLLSFSRLMALGLTSSAMAMVFNILGVMVGGGIVGKLFMLIILLIGHAVNIALNALGAYVHTLRLQYVELFSKFYEGGGRVFRPLAYKSKYTRIKEEK